MPHILPITGRTINPLVTPTITNGCVDSMGNTLDSFILNTDGTVSGYDSAYNSTNLSLYGPNFAQVVGQPLPLECCNNLGFTYNTGTSQCFWRYPCSPTNPFKIVFPPDGNSGAIFEVGDDENCYLQVDFDYLLMFDCATLMACATSNLANVVENEITNIELQMSQLQEQYLELSSQYDTVYSAMEVACAGIFSNQLCLDLQAECASLNSQMISIQSQITSATTQINTIISANTITGCLSKSFYVLENSIYNYEALILTAQTQMIINASNGTSNSALNSEILLLQQKIVAAQTQQYQMILACTPTTTCNIVPILTNINLWSTIEAVAPSITTQIPGGPPVLMTTTTQLITEYQTPQPFFSTTNNLAQYLNGNSNTGIIFTGSSCIPVPGNNCTDNCQAAICCIIDELGSSGNVVSANTFNSCWKHCSYTITDQVVLSAITNMPIELGIVINGCNCNFSLLLDNIQLNKICTLTESQEIFVNHTPGFDLTRTIDNKKSWTNYAGVGERISDINIRYTDYMINDPRLVLNTKEIDLDLDGSDAIECNVFNYIQATDECILNTELCIGESGSTVISYSAVPIINSAFDINLSGWTATPITSFIQYSGHGGEALYVGFEDGGSLIQSLALQSGQTYAISFDMYVYDINATLMLTVGGESIEVDNNGLGDYSLEYTFISQTDINSSIELYCTGAQYNSIGFNNISINQITGITLTGCPEWSTVNDLLTTPFTSITTTEQFVNVFSSELIDVKDRQTLGAYPTLRFIYDSYLHSEIYGCPTSAKYTYCDLNKFIGLIGTYWVDIIEQLVPATTIWGATYVYRNTIFDQPAYKYRKGTTYFCTPTVFSNTASTFCTVLASASSVNTVQVILTDLTIPATGSSINNINCGTPTSNICYALYIDQLDDGSEFRGTVSYLTNPFPYNIIPFPYNIIIAESIFLH